MPQPPPDLADRIRRARNAADLTQQALAERVGVDLRTVQGWESGRVPRDIGVIERALHADLTTPPASTSPRLDEASDAMLIAALAGRLADRDRTIRDLRAAQSETTDPGTVLDSHGRWTDGPTP